VEAEPRTAPRAAIESYFHSYEAEILEHIAAGVPLATALNQLVHAVEGYGKTGMLVSVLLIDETGKHLRLGAAPSLPSRYNAAIDGIEIGPNVGSCGTAAYCKHAIYVVDIENDPLWKDFKELALSHNLRACWSVPVLGGKDELLGTLAMYYRERRSPTNVDRELVHHGGRIAAQVIQSARLHASRQGRASA
jgi:GAF domain-containing protein